MTLLNKLLERCLELALIKPKGKQHTDATHILGAVYAMTRMEQIGESMHTALNAVAATTPARRQAWAPLGWYERYDRHVEQQRLPKSKTAQEWYMLSVGQDMELLLKMIQQSETHQWLLNLPQLIHLQAVLDPHYDLTSTGIRVRSKQAVSKLPPGIESPYDPEVRCRERHEQPRVGYSGIRHI